MNVCLFKKSHKWRSSNRQNGNNCSTRPESISKTKKNCKYTPNQWIIPYSYIKPLFMVWPCVFVIHFFFVFYSKLILLFSWFVVVNTYKYTVIGFIAFCLQFYHIFDKDFCMTTHQRFNAVCLCRNKEERKKNSTIIHINMKRSIMNNVKHYYHDKSVL